VARANFLTELPISGPRVSVLIDTYNHERFIEKAITSVLDQDFPAGYRESIVVDDDSTDGTSEVVQRFIPHVRYIRKVNGGQGSAFNAGIPECRGELTELGMYRLLHSDVSWTHRLFKYATLLPAYALPPRFYGALRRRLVSNQWYLNARKVFFPVPRLRHVKRLPRTEI
jgi:glycosyltransferase involved in cell wall biosynthesis